MDWTKPVWRFLCLLVIMSGLVVFTPLWWVMSPILQGIAVVPGLVVMLLIVVSSFASSTGSSTPPDGSTARSGGPDADA